MKVSGMKVSGMKVSGMKVGGMRRAVPPTPVGSAARAAVLLATTLLITAACNDDGRDLRDPTFPLPPTTTTTVPPGETVGPAVVTQAPVSFALVAPWQNGADVPARHTCDADDLSPALTWTGVPAGTVELAITVTDLDADDFVHWVVTGIDPATTGLVEGSTPTGAVEWTNDFTRPGWAGPCPPAGEPAHLYLFTVHALNQPLRPADDASAAEVVELLNQQAVAQASISGRYARPG